jgi:ATP phosphoribosyltransferase regulatory subunit
VLRIRGTQLRSERQFGQAGVELIGARQDAGDAEVVLLAATALAAAGVSELSIDLNLPTLVAKVAADLGQPEAVTARLRQALDRKDSAAVSTLAGADAPLFQALLQAAGPAEPALAALGAIALPAGAAEELARLDQVVALIRRADPELTLTIDPAEHRGFEYQTGLSFTLFAAGVRGELGRGGRYETEQPDGGSESSTGFTLYMDTVLRALPPAEAPKRLFLPAGSGPEDGRALRQAGWVTVAGLDASADPRREARRLDCGHLLLDGRVTET